MIEIFGNPIFLAIFGPILGTLIILIGKSIWTRSKKKNHSLRNSSHDYAKSYRERHGQLKAACVGLKEHIPLDNIYVDVKFLNQKSTSENGTLEDIEMALREKSKETSESSSDERQDAMRVAYDEQYLMVLGGPGVGKSTFLRKVGLEALKGKSGNFEHELVPVFFELKRFTLEQFDIETLIIQEFKICGYPYPEQMVKTTLESGNLLILLDGLDEVPAANVDNFVDKIRNFVEQHHQIRFIISSRIEMNIGASTEFTKVKITDFDDSQIETFLNNWFSSTSNEYQSQLENRPTTANLCWGTLNLREHQAIKELVRNPLLLTLLCADYETSEDFPRNRAELYERTLNIFLEEWQGEKHVSPTLLDSQKLDVLDKKLLLSEIAANNFEEDQLLFKKEELISQIKDYCDKNSITLSTSDSRKVFESIVVEHGFFVEQANSVYSFLHLTFQEYLTGNYFVRTQSISKLVTEHLHDERWREVFLFAAELMLAEADGLLVKMESEASKSINTDGLKALFQWAKCITNPSDIQGNRIAKPTFAVRQFFALWIFNKINEKVKDIDNRYPNLKIDCKSRSYLEYISQKHDADQECDQEGNYTRTISYDIYRNLHKYLDKERDADIYQDLNVYRNLHQPLYRNLHVDPDIILYRNQAIHGVYSHEFHHGYDFYRPLHQNLHYEIYEILHPDYNQDFKLYIYLYLYLFQDLDYMFMDQNFNLTLDLYHDLYRYIEPDCYTFIFTKFWNRFERELDRRISFIEYMDDAKIFKEMDLQRVLLRINEQRKFIEAVREGKSVNPPEESIHDTWISVLEITDDMLAISTQEMLNYIRYLRAMKLIYDCKKVARDVAPDMWLKIEDRLLVTDF